MSQVSKEKMGFCAMMRSLSGSVVRSEAEYSRSEALVGLEMEMPPSLAGRAKRWHFIFLYNLYRKSVPLNRPERSLLSQLYVQ